MTSKSGEQTPSSQPRVAGDAPRGLPKGGRRLAEEEQLRLGSLSQPGFEGREGSRAEGKACPVGTVQGLASQARTARTARPGRCQAASGRIEKASQAAAGLCMPRPHNRGPCCVVVIKVSFTLARLNTTIYIQYLTVPVCGLFIRALPTSRLLL